MKVAAAVALVVDTSYLLELYKVPGFCDEKHTKPVRSRFAQSIKKHHSLFVPFPIIFEMANHIAHVKNSVERRRLARSFVQDVKESIESASPWTITSVAGDQFLLQLNELLWLCEKYRDNLWIGASASPIPR